MTSLPPPGKTEGLAGEGHRLPSVRGRPHKRTASQHNQFRRMRGLQADVAFAVVAHEIRSPVAGIASHAWTLEQYWDRLTEVQRLESVRDMRHRARYLERLITDLLTITRAEAGNPIDVAFRPVDLTPVVLGVAHDINLEPPAGTKIRLDSDIPMVLTDVDRARQVFANLLHNAVKFSPGVDSVTVSHESTPLEVIVHVRDQGPGIARKDIARLFRPFVRLVDGGPGSGIGLYVAKILMDALRGRVWAQSSKGAGSTFSCAFPRWPADPA